jgi:hypothetical protein
MLMKCHEHLHASIKSKRSFVDKDIFNQNYSLDIFEQTTKGVDPPTLLICFSHPPPPLSRLLPLIFTTSVFAFLIPPHSLYRHAMNPLPEATYDDVNALKAACK